MESPEAKNPPEPKPVPYKRVEVEDGFEAMRRWDWSRVENGCRAVGDCPRCHHRTEKVIPNEAVVLKLAMADALAADEPVGIRKHVVECDCGMPHPERPDDGKGCGARWGVRLRNTDLDREGDDA